MAEERKKYSENYINNINTYLPVEILNKIFVYLDVETLLCCKLTCKQWRNSIQEVVWRRKAESNIGQKLPASFLRPWQFYYLVCEMKFRYNLLENLTHRSTTTNFSPFNTCFECEILETQPAIAGFPHLFFDLEKPPIKVSISYRYLHEEENPAANFIKISILNESWYCIDKFLHGGIQSKTIVDKDNWVNISHVFGSYGNGVRIIRFEYGGIDCEFANISAKIMTPNQPINMTILTFYSVESLDNLI